MNITPWRVWSGAISMRKWEFRDRDLEFSFVWRTIRKWAQLDGRFLSISKKGSHQQNNRSVYMYRSDNIPRVQSSHSTTNSPCVYLQKDLTSAATASTSLYQSASTIVFVVSRARRAWSLEGWCPSSCNTPSPPPPSSSGTCPIPSCTAPSPGRQIVL